MILQFLIILLIFWVLGGLFRLIFRIAFGLIKVIFLVLAVLAVPFLFIACLAAGVSLLILIPALIIGFALWCIRRA